ncbi:30S ribosomal protein S3 [Roseimicrobium sp. ORNL1]|uniref:30S ribosomal protein S3 n=1 Tax=Roseimicrobium sp. ORNL1 TaxID=2711231 RepID=UPI0013E1C86B|nr:30S ribosomal protein S3 [Roseimicrobium sp. ORNL1]QIF01180.1 30S ribosomal protein S3 [Roseimicrobium sp. ORNL1]
MGQKVNPIGFRLAVNKDWRSKWYAPEKDYAEFLHADLAIRDYLKKKLSSAALAKIVIERAWNLVRVTLHTARPGLVIGRKGQEIEVMSNEISKMCGGKSVKIDILEIKQPEIDAQLVAESVATQLERRISFRRAMKRAVQTAMDMGADGIRIRCAGRLGGADIARAEQYRQGKVPLQTLRINIDYGFTEARTVYGIIGVKCWLNRKPEVEGAPAPERRQERRPRREGDRGPRGGGGGGGYRGGDRGDRGGDRGGDRQASAPAPAPAEAPAAQ